MIEQMKFIQYEKIILEIMHENKLLEKKTEHKEVIVTILGPAGK